VTYKKSIEHKEWALKRHKQKGRNSTVQIATQQIKTSLSLSLCDVTLRTKKSSNIELLREIHACNKTGHEERPQKQSATKPQKRHERK
jgi:hypothetical protein